jgi:hypothetical protein
MVPGIAAGPRRADDEEPTASIEIAATLHRDLPAIFEWHPELDLNHRLQANESDAA